MVSVFATILSSAWSGFVVGLLILTEGTVFLVLRRRPQTTAQPRKYDQIWMLISLGVTATVGSAAELRGWRGTGASCVLAIGFAAALSALVFGVRSLVRG